MAEFPITHWLIKKLKRNMSLVEDTDTASQNISQGKFVNWKGDLCKSSSAITAGDTLSSNNLSSVDEGGLNELNDHIATLLKSQKNGNFHFLKFEDGSEIAWCYATRGATTTNYDPWMNTPSGFSITANNSKHLLYCRQNNTMLAGRTAPYDSSHPYPQYTPVDSTNSITLILICFYEPT